MLDGFLVILCGALAYLVQPFLQTIIPFLKGSVPVGQYATLILFWLPLWISAVLLLGLHRVFDRPFRQSSLIWGLLRLHGICFIAISVITYVTQLELNRSLVLVFFSLSFVFMYATRTLLSLRLKHQYTLGYGRRNILLVGNAGSVMDNFCSQTQHHPFPPRILGRLSDESTNHAAQTVSSSIPVIGTPDDLVEYLHGNAVDEVIYFPPCNSPSSHIHLLDACEEVGVPAFFSIDMEQPTQSAPRFAMQHNTPFVLFDIAPKRQDALALKHTLDVAIAIFCIVLFSPLMALVTIAIIVSMGRPILFFQNRAGRNGREFKMLKFRTMQIDAEAFKARLMSANEMDGPVFKMTGDPRITKLGAFLRRFSIDELPQLFNVVGGSMSLVGPRPLPVGEQQGIAGWRRRRLSMKPGITGIWQVSGRNDIDFENWMKLDLEYVDNWSLFLDIKILFKTIHAVFNGRGAK